MKKVFSHYSVETSGGICSGNYITDFSRENVSVGDIQKWKEDIAKSLTEKWHPVTPEMVVLTFFVIVE